MDMSLEDVTLREVALMESMQREIDSANAERDAAVARAEQAEAERDAALAAKWMTPPDAEGDGGMTWRAAYADASAVANAAEEEIGRLRGLPVIDAAHLERQREWSARTFGPGTRTKGVIAHIRKELTEIEADPSDVTEWIDVVILALDGAWRAGHEPQAIIDAIRAKQAKNEARTWPDWRTMSQDEAIEHDRSHDDSNPFGQKVCACGWANHDLRGKCRNCAAALVTSDDSGERIFAQLGTSPEYLPRCGCNCHITPAQLVPSTCLCCERGAR